jgi:hypothetical protein
MVQRPLSTTELEEDLSRRFMGELGGCHEAPPWTARSPAPPNAADSQSSLTDDWISFGA